MRRFVALVFFTMLGPAVALGQESASPMIHGAEVRISAKKWEDAERFLKEEALVQFPQNAQLWYQLGIVYAQGSNRNTEEAAKAFAKANEFASPDDDELRGKVQTALKAIWGPLVNSAAKAAEENKLEEAEKLLKQATALNPEGPEAWVNLGTVYLRQKKNHEAVQAYEKALALQPDSPTVSYNLGIVYHQLARDAKAAGKTAQATEYGNKAEATYKAYLAKNPDDVDIKNSLAALYQERGDEAKMRETLGDVSTASAATQADHYNAGRAFLKGKEYAKADEAFAKVIAMTDNANPESVDMSHFAMEYHGLALLQLKKYDKAIEVLKKLIQSQPDNFTAHEYLGYAYRDSGRKEEAAAEFTKAEELKKKQGSGGASEQQSSSQ
jgi:tetratricopeptide (TPR) repeat protein